MPRPVNFIITIIIYVYTYIIENILWIRTVCNENSLQVAIKRDAGQELEVQKWISEVLGDPNLFDSDPYEDVLKVVFQTTINI